MVAPFIDLRDGGAENLVYFAFWDCGFESLLDQGRLFLFNVLSFQVEISATGRFLVQRSRSECDVSECDREASVMWWPWPTSFCCVIKNYIWSCIFLY